MSVEFMIYIAISVSSLAAGALLFERGSADMRAREGSAYIEGFVAAVNSNMGYTQSYITVFVPNQICDAVVGPTGLVYGNATYGFDGNVSLDMASICKYGGGIARLHMERMYNGTLAVG